MSSHRVVRRSHGSHRSEEGTYVATLTVSAYCSIHPHPIDLYTINRPDVRDSSSFVRASFRLPFHIEVPYPWMEVGDVIRYWIQMPHDLLLVSDVSLIGL